MVVWVNKQVHLLLWLESNVECFARALRSLNRRMNGLKVSAPSHWIFFELYPLREIDLIRSLGSKWKLLEVQPSLFVTLFDDWWWIFCNLEPQGLILVIEDSNVGFKDIVIRCNFTVDNGVVFTYLNALYLLLGYFFRVLVEFKLKFVAEKPKLAVIVISCKLLAVLVFSIEILLWFFYFDNIDGAVGDGAFGLLIQVIVLKRSCHKFEQRRLDVYVDCVDMQCLFIEVELVALSVI